MSLLAIPEGLSPADIVGESEFLAGQTWLVKRVVLKYAWRMQAGTFPWNRAQAKEPIVIQVGRNGRVLSQGHHRYVAAKLAQVDIPVMFTVVRDYWPGDVPYAHPWTEVEWDDTAMVQEGIEDDEPE